MEGEGNHVAAWWERWGWSLEPFLVPAALSVLIAGSVYAISDAVLAPTPVPKEPGFIDTVLGSHAVVAAIRLAIIFAGAFVVVSVVALAKRGQWLVRVGPVQVSERLSDVYAENQRVDESLEESREAIRKLEQELAESNYLLDRATREQGERDAARRNQEAN